MLRIIVGLGNPGSKYAYTRHNVGFRVIDQLANQLGIKVKESFCHSLIGVAKYQGEDIILGKPQTYMNDSGRAVKALLEYHGFALEELLIVYDDVELDLGRLRIRRRGSHGGHNGVKSIIAQLGTVEFPRLRIGVGKAPEDKDLMEYVLGEFGTDEEEIMTQAQERAVEAIKCIYSDGIEIAMNRFN